MDTRKTILSLLVLSLVGFGFGFGYVLTNSYDLDLCFADFETLTYDVSCHQLYERIGNPFFYGMGALTLVFLLLLVFPKTFSTWKKFAIWFVPLATLLFVFYPEPGSGDLFSPYPEQVFQWVSAFYVVASLVIILAAHLVREEE